MILSQNSYTPISFWLSVSLRELVKWIETSNQIVKEAREQREHAKAKQRAARLPVKRR